MKEIKYIIEDTRDILNEKDIIQMYLQYEVNDIYDNAKDYIQGTYNLSSQLKLIENIKNDNIENIIYMLNMSWNVPIKKLSDLDILTEIICDKIKELKKINNFEEMDITKEFINGYIQGLKFVKDEIQNINGVEIYGD